MGHSIGLFEPALKHKPIAESSVMSRVLALAHKVAAVDISVLISGASGTGKEVIARYIHEKSLRCKGPFVAINCAAIPESMLEATLFGHEKGAFTGASDKRIGKFEQANGGTLLLDEITEMPIELQAKLLRVLQEREIERLGSNRIQNVDVRVVATSNRELKIAISQGLIREDLYYRLSVFPLHIPALVDRKDEVVGLARHFLQKYAAGNNYVLSADAKAALMEYSWPGNIRELENVIQRGLVLCETGEISAKDLFFEHPETAKEENLNAKLQTREEQVLLETLNRYQGGRKQTAQQLGISERTLRYKLAQLRERGVQI